MFRLFLLTTLLALFSLTGCEVESAPPAQIGDAREQSDKLGGPDLGGFIRADPCDYPVSPTPTEPLACGTSLLLDAGAGGPLPAAALHCNYPAGDYQLLQTSGNIVIKMEMCDGGAVVVFDGNACYGAASFGDEWAVFPLPGHTIGVSGGKYLLTTQDC